MIAETFSGLWYIHEPFAARMQDMILPRLSAGKDPLPAHFQVGAKIDSYDKDGNFDPDRVMLNRFLKTGGGDVAVIPIEGAMSRFGICGMGNEFTATMLALALAEPSVKGVVLKAHTPGGTVDSVEMLADAVRDFAKTKPVVGYVNGMCASAGVFGICASSAIVMENSAMAEIGSIGVLSVHIDQSKALEKNGLSVKIYRASDSVDKARFNGVEPMTDELEQEIQAELDAAMKTFKGYVRRGRAGKLTSDEIFTGKMYKRKDALRLGLVDSLGSLGDAIKLARRM